MATATPVKDPEVVDQKSKSTESVPIKTEWTSEDLSKVELSDIRITSYWKYEFTMSADSKLGPIVVVCGGDSDRIYRFDPLSGWKEWIGVGIKYLAIDGREITVTDTDDDAPLE